MKKGKAQLKAWETIRLNKELGLTGSKTFTKQKAENYLSKNQTTKLIEGIVRNAEKPINEISKIIRKSPSTIQKFFLHAIESVVLGKPKVGKPLEMPALIKYANRKKAA